MIIEFIKKTATGKIAFLLFLCFVFINVICLFDRALASLIVYNFGLNPSLDLWNLIKLPITLITSMFIHVRIDHFLFNFIALLSFGPMVEAMVGKKEFLKIFFGSGILGGILYIIVCNIFGSYSIAIGASGALSGLLGFLSVVRPNTQVLFIFIPMNIVFGTILFILISLYLMVFVDPNAFNIAHAAHLGGVLFGIYYGFKKIKKRIDHFEHDI